MTCLIEDLSIHVCLMVISYYVFKHAFNNCFYLEPILVTITDGGTFAQSLPARQVRATSVVGRLLCTVRLCTPFVNSQDFVNNSGPNNLLGNVSQLN
jgi:hypothetical protein